MTFRLPILIAAGAIAVSPVAASAAAPHQGPTTFDGRCSLDGRGATDRPLGITPQTDQARHEGAGTCSGTLDGRTVDAVAVTYTAAFSDPLHACASSLANGVWELRFANGPRLTLYSQAYMQSTVWTSKVSGRAVGVVTALTEVDRRDPDGVSQCVAHASRSFPVGVTLQTLGPIVG